jgi:hypothetical protein
VIGTISIEPHAISASRKIYHSTDISITVSSTLDRPFILELLYYCDTSRVNVNEDKVGEELMYKERSTCQRAACSSDVEAKVFGLSRNDM